MSSKQGIPADAGGNTNPASTQSADALLPDPATTEDTDSDGIADLEDACPNTPAATGTNAAGCSPEDYGVTDATGTSFRLSGISLTTSVSVHVTLASARTSSVVFAIEQDPLIVETSVEVTITGFKPATPYFLYRDTLTTHTDLMATAAGSITFTQDITTPHLIILQDTPSTIFIDGITCPAGWSCTPTTATAPGGSQITQTINITGPDLTVDLNGSSVIGAGVGNGLVVSANNVTVRNGDFSGWNICALASQRSHVTFDHLQCAGPLTHGFLFVKVTTGTIQQSAVTGAGNSGIVLIIGGSNNTITDTTSTGSVSAGLFALDEAQLTVTGSDFGPSPGNGISLDRSTQVTISDSQTNQNSLAGLIVGNSNKVTFERVAMNDNGRFGLAIVRSTQVTGTSLVANNNALRGAFIIEQSAVTLDGTPTFPGQFNQNGQIGINCTSGSTIHVGPHIGATENVGTDIIIGSTCTATKTPPVLCGTILGGGIACDAPVVDQPPVVTIASAVDGQGNTLADGGKTLSSAMAFAFTVTDDLDPNPTLTCLLDGGALPCTSPTTMSVVGLAVGTHTFAISATDSANQTSEASFSWTVQSPEAALTDLIAQVEGLQLPTGIENSLVTKLEGAQVVLKQENIGAAKGKLGAFINEVEAQAGKTITQAKAQALVDTANQIIKAAETFSQCQPPPTERNFDARIALTQDIVVSPNMSQLAAAAILRESLPDLAARYEKTTGALRTLYNMSGYLTGVQAQVGDPATLALDYVQNHLELFGLSLADLNNLEPTDSVFSKVTGATHLYWRQTYQGFSLYNGQLHVNVNRDGRVLSVNNAFLPGIAKAVNTSQPALPANEAVRKALLSLGVCLMAPPAQVKAPEGVTQHTVVDSTGISQEAIEAHLMWVPIQQGKARLVWNFQLVTLDSQHAYDMTVDAVTGEVLTRFDWVAEDSYTVYHLPVESPNHTTPAPPADGRVLVTNPADATASPFGWHDTDGVAGAEYTVRRGNNVYAYDDQNADNAPPSVQLGCGASLACTFSIDLTQDPSNYVTAAVTNLFYWNNIIHDVMYQYGFDEVGGNFQENNYGAGGVSGDPVLAEAQDGSGTNNANFGARPDGTPSRMQMYLYDKTTPRRDGDLDNGIISHEYAHGISHRLVGGPSTVSCLSNAQHPGEGISDWYSIVFTHEAGDSGTDPRSHAGYANGSSTGNRNQQYSTDPSVNTYDYESIRGVSESHSRGEVWAQGAWEVYWALVNAHGFDADLYNAIGGSGNQRALLYFTEGLKNTACSPTFVDVRDGVIQAATDNYDGEDLCSVWRAFAEFGLGEDADPDSSSGLNVTNGFEFPVGCQCVSAPAPGHLVAWWPLDETTRRADIFSTVTAQDIIGGHDGTHEGPCGAGICDDFPIPVDGMVDGALEFDGYDDYVNVPDDDSLDVGTGDFTIDAWIKPHGISGTMAIVDKRFPGAGGVFPMKGYSLFLEDGCLSLSIGDGMSETYTVPSAMCLSSVETHWYHVGAAVERGQAGGVLLAVSSFDDGLFRSTTVAATKEITLSLANGEDLRIGNRRTLFADTDHFDGAIDEVEFFDRALSMAELRSIFWAGVSGKCKACAESPSDLVSWWRLEETSGTTATDTVSGNTGTLQGSPLPTTAGSVDGALTFDGSADYVEVPDTSSLDVGTGDFSIDAWVRPDTVSGTRVIVEKRHSSQVKGKGVQMTGYSFFLEEGCLSVRLGDGSGVGVTFTAPDLDCIAADGDWHFIGVSVHRLSIGATFTFHLDGEEDSFISTTAPTGSLSNAADFLIGTRRSGSGSLSDQFSGGLDEVEFFNRALSVEEFVEIYRSGPIGKCP
ncbi:MAG: M36 family metallopeptidase [Deltaproteobacteria bacterium]|nr:M36 family metallopeptidase [Deltaproteobacteria bacterium]